MKHLDVRYMWLQDLMDKGAYSAKKIPREGNPSVMHSHTHRRRQTLRSSCR